MIAEIGAGYGLVGRLLPQNPAGEMSITQAEARSIAAKTVAGIDANSKLHDAVDTYYGFYEVHVLRAGEFVGELDVNGYNGQVWYKEWGEPQFSLNLPGSSNR